METILIVILVLMVIGLLTQNSKQRDTIKGHRETITEYKRSRHG